MFRAPFSLTPHHGAPEEAQGHETLPHRPPWHSGLQPVGESAASVGKERRNQRERHGQAVWLGAGRA